MSLRTVLVANRGEIAIRIMRAAAELGIRSVAVYSEDDANSLHVRKADEARPLRGRGAAAYLDIEQLLSVAAGAGCDAVHPGYGFLAENAEFARRCAAAGVTFVGPTPEALALLGDKAAARALAAREGVPVLAGTHGPVTLDEAKGFMEGLGRPIVIKAVAGGGGRGMRIVRDLAELPAAYERCRSEARAAFGNGDVYAEQLMERARHVEVQVIADATGAASHVWERECSLQRRNQKLVEVAPSPALSDAVRARLCDAAVRLAAAAGYQSLGTFEFLVDATGGPGDDTTFAFIEANARLQVEHTVTEEVTAIDLVKAQLQVAGGATLSGLRLDQPHIPAPRGYAIQLRVNTETMDADGTVRPAGGTLAAFEPPTGPGIRVDTYGYTGYRTNPSFDSLLAKVIAHAPDGTFADAVAKAYRALCEFRIEGVATNLPFLQALLKHPEVAAGRFYTRFVDDHVEELVSASAGEHRRLYFEAPNGGAASRLRAGVRVDPKDPLAVLAYGKSGGPPPGPAATVEEPPAPAEYDVVAPEGTVAVRAPMQGTVVSIAITPGEAVRKGQQLFVMEAMKMEHVIAAGASGIVRSVEVEQGDTVYEGAPLAFIEEQEIEGGEQQVSQEVDPDYIRPDLAEIIERHRLTFDEARPDAVERRRRTGQRTARENIEDLCDPGTFVEHGGLALTPGTGLPMEEVIRKFPGDGMVCGVGSVNGDLFPEPTNRCVVLSYDYTVLAGTQGALNHPKTDRMLELAEKWRLPVVFFTEGGGGRAGTGGRRPGGRDVAQYDGFAGRPLDTPTFATMARLSGLVPLVGINSGRCFAGNAALLGCCDVIIATANSNIGMGGPAMVEGGGLGVFRPEDIGPMSVQVPNGVVDIAVADEAEAVKAAKQYLSYFQGPIDRWDTHDQRLLRHIVPENRLRMYDVRKVIETVADAGSVLELRPKFGLGMVTALARIEGRPVGIIANNPGHLAGAIDSDGADKAARFMQLLDAFGIPLVVFCDTPGIMVGPEIEKTALVRHCSRLFVTGANLTIPHVTVVLRKAYGLGAQAMAGGSFKEPFFAVAWPTGEFAGMGLEGQVKLGFRNELEAIEDPEERRKRYEDLLARAYERSKAIHQGVSFGVDDVIDPADTRRWILSALQSVRPGTVERHKPRPNIDTW
ncbi:MAG: pyruvate carboxylase [Dehalococcoidia bacterium]